MLAVVSVNDLPMSQPQLENDIGTQPNPERSAAKD